MDVRALAVTVIFGAAMFVAIQFGLAGPPELAWVGWMALAVLFVTSLIVGSRQSQGRAPMSRRAQILATVALVAVGVAIALAWARQMPVPGEVFIALSLAAMALVLGLSAWGKRPQVQ